MKTIELTDNEYNVLLKFKNHVSMKVTGITNTMVLGECKKNCITPKKLMGSYDFEPKFTFGKCIVDTIGSVMNEQKTGVVNYIT